MRAIISAFLLLAGCGEVGSASIGPDGRMTTHNDRPFPVLSASKIIPAAMALERRDPSLDNLILLSVVNSDNDAADRLTARLGGKVAVQRWLAFKRLPSAFATEAEMVAEPTAYELRPSDLALILYRIKSPELVALMAQTKTGNDRIRAAFPGAPHKSGTWGTTYLSDVGVVGDGVVAVMGEKTSAQALRDEALKSAGKQRLGR